MCSKLTVFLTSFVLVFGIACADVAFAAEIDLKIVDGGNDAEQHVGDGSMDIGSTDLEMPYEDAGNPATDEQVTGLRYVGVPLEKGGAITSAYIVFEVDSVSKEGSANPVNLIIEGELSANAAAFADVANNITDRPRTTAKVRTSMPAWAAVNKRYKSPDISSIIQEIVGQEGWALGNSLVLIIRDDKDNPSTGLREAESVEGEAAAAPVLHLEGDGLVLKPREPNPVNGATGAQYAPTVSTYYSTDVPKSVPDFSASGAKNIAGEVTSTLDVADSFKVSDLNVELDISASDDVDFVVSLKSPDGKKVELFSEVGFGQRNFTNTIINDEAASSILGKTGPYTGIYKPETGKLSDFDGREAKGTWKLTVQDVGYRSRGTLNSWRLVIEKPVVVSWTPGGAGTQDLYFASSFDDVNNSAAAAYKGNLAADASILAVGVLDLGTTYYWRIDQVGADGAKDRGDIWSFTTAAGNVVVDRRISDGLDDVEERIGEHNGDMDTTSSDLEFPYEDTGQGDPQIVGLRFVNVGLPAGAEVVESYLEFEVDETKGGTEPVNVIIDAELAADAEPFADVAGNISSRSSRTTATVPWSVPDWTANNVKWQTPDISAIVAELAGQEGWAAGNAMVFIIEDDPCNPSVGVRCAEAVEGESSAAVLLHVAGVTEVASAPGPADEAVDVAQSPTLRWSAGFSAVSHDVYFGTSSSPAKLETTTGRRLKLPKLATSTTYYWRVDEIEANGTKHVGTVWSFTTIISEATQPNPADKAAGVALDAKLSWKAGATAATHDVYFGTTDSMEFVGNQVETSFDPNGLEASTIYYWRVDEVEADPNIVHEGAVWSFTTVTGEARQPDPADGALIEQTWVMLSWTAGPTAASHDVYIGTAADALELQASQAETTLTVGLPELPIPDGLVPGTTYYWRVDEVEADPNIVYEGAVWSFTVAPLTAYNPSPANGATDVATDAVISWTPGLGAKLHSVYFGDNLDTVANATGAAPMPVTTFNPGLLEEGKTYYWRVDEFNPPNTITGTVWSFTTLGTIAPPPEEWTEL